MNLRNRTLTSFQNVKSSFKIPTARKHVKEALETKPVSNAILAELIIISADDSLTKDGATRSKEYQNFSARLNSSYNDLPDRIGGLEQAIRRVLANDNKKSRYSNEHLERLKIWAKYLERYKDDEELLQKAKEILGLKLEISTSSLSSALSNLKMLLQKHKEIQEAQDMNTKTENLEVALVSNDYLREAIWSGTNKELSVFINFDELDELFPNFTFIKGDVVTLNAMYEDGDYNTEIAVSFFLTSTQNNFDTVAALVTDFNSEINEYDTSLKLINSKGFAKFVQDIFNEKEISYIEPENIVELLKLLSATQ